MTLAKTVLTWEAKVIAVDVDTGVDAAAETNRKHKVTPNQDLK